MSDPAPDVLIVDDDRGVREVFVDLFADHGYSCHTAADGVEGLKQFDRVRPALAITDVKMPEMNGIEFLRRALRLDPEAAIIVLTGYGDVPMAVESLRLGAYHFLMKPVNGDELLIIAERALHHRALLRERREYEALVDRRVGEATSALSATAAALEAAYMDILELLAVLASPAGETAASVHRVPAYAARVAAALGASAEEATAIRHATLLRDIGRILTVREDPETCTRLDHRPSMERHPEIGRRLLERVPALRDTAAIVHHHHEHWDGSGYPAGLRGEAIPLGARVVAVAEALEALSLAYGDDPDPMRVAREAIRRAAGTDFDPKVVSALLSIPTTILDDIRLGGT